MNKPQTFRHYDDQDRLIRAESHVRLLQQAMRVMINRLLASDTRLTLAEMEQVQQAIRGEI